MDMTTVSLSSWLLSPVGFHQFLNSAGEWLQ